MIDILLATYNGERYLAEMLDSLDKQTNKEWKLIVIDDCSKDRTVEILHSYAKEKEDGRVMIIQNETAEGCGKNNFMKLLKHSASDYFMFCDQDDVWLPEKIEKTLALMQQTEISKKYEKTVPALVHTDLKVVDEHLNVMQESFFAYSRLRKDFSLKYLLCQNSITGCTLMGNAQLRKIAIAKDTDFDRLNMHDEWLGLIACCFGKIGYLDEPTILYRQHGGNTVGATDAGNMAYQLKRLRAYEKLKQSNMDHVREAAYFLELFGEKIQNPENKEIFEAFVSTEDKSAMCYRMNCMKHGMLKYPAKRAIVQIVLAHR